MADPAISNSNNNNARGRRRSNWVPFFNCGQPMSVTRLAFLATAITLILKIGISNLSYFSFLADVGWILLWAVVAMTVYVLDVGLIAICRSKSWLEVNPVKEWPIYPKTYSGGMNWFLLLVIVLLIAYMAFGDKITSWADLWPFTAATLSSSDGEVEARPSNVPVDDSISETDIVIRNADGTSTVVPIDHCRATNWREARCASLPAYLSYWKQARAMTKDLADYNISALKKCSQCGDVITGSNRVPDDCNPFIPTLRFKDLKTDSWVESVDCTEPPTMIDWPGV